MSESNIKELTKSPFKGENTDNYDKYFNILHKIFKKYENKTEEETVDKLGTEIEKLMIKIKDPLEAYIYGTILHDNNFHEYAEMFTKKAQDLGYDINESNENVLKGDDITIYWKGLSVDKGLIGNFIVSPKLHDKIEKQFKSEISIDFNDENVETSKLNVYKDVVNAMKKTEYGKILFKEAVGTIDLPKDIAKDILPAIEQEKGEDGTYTVKDLENTMLVNGASLKLLDDVVSELVNMGFDFDTEDEKDNDYTMEENNTNENNTSLLDVFAFLDDLKKDGTEMRNAEPFIMSEFPETTRDEAQNMLISWAEYKTGQVDESRETTDIEKEVFIYLNDLRESGVTNMFGATHYIMDEFPDLDKNEASALLSLWMKNFNDEGNYNEINESNQINEDFDKDKRKEMSREIKRKYKDFRFSIRGDFNHISVDILSGPINFLKDEEKREYLQVNYYLIKTNWSGEAEKMLSDIYEIINSENYTVSEDGDYGSIPNYYINMSIGQWDRPFVYTGDEVEDEANTKEQEAVTESFDYEDYFRIKLSKFDVKSPKDLTADQWDEIDNDWETEKKEKNKSKNEDNNTYKETTNVLMDRFGKYGFDVKDNGSLIKEVESKLGTITLTIFGKDLLEEIQDTTLSISYNDEDNTILRGKYKIEYFLDSELNSIKNTDNPELVDYILNKLGFVGESTNKSKVNEGFENRIIVNDVGDELKDKLFEYISNILFRTRSIDEQTLKNIIGGLAFDLVSGVIESDGESIEELANITGKMVEELSEELSTVINSNRQLFDYDESKINEGFENRIIVNDVGDELKDKLFEYISTILFRTRSINEQTLKNIIGGLAFDLVSGVIESDGESIEELANITGKMVEELSEELSIVINSNRQLFDYDESKINESLSSKEDKIDYIIFHTEKDKSILNQMSDAVIDTIYAEIVKEYSGEIVDVENGIDKFNEENPDLDETGVNNALVDTDDEHNFMTEEELRNFGKTEESILSFDKFKSVVVEYKDGGFNDNIIEGFKIKNPVKHVSEKKFTTTDINEAYKMYESFMRLFEESNSAITEKMRSVTIKYENGDIVNTSMAAGLTDEEIKNYFKIGSYFNIGSTEDNMQKVEEVIINDNDTDDTIENDTIENDTIENDTIENDVANENLNEKYKPLVPHKQVMPYAGGLENPWVIYPDSVEAPVKEDYDIVAIKNLIASDNFLRFAYENIMTGEFYEDMKTMYETYIKDNDENMAKMKTFESYAKYIIDETLFVSKIATLMLENMESEITDEIKREIYLNLNELTNYHNELKNNLAISTPKFKFDIKEAFKSNIKEKLNEFKDNKIMLESFNDSNVLDYNNNSVSALKSVLESVSNLFNTTSLELNSELSVVASLALLKQ